MRKRHWSMPPKRAPFAVAVCTVAGLLASCSKELPTGPGSSAPAALLIQGGQDQTTTVGAELPVALTVKVVDANGRPVRGQPVNFRVVAGGGSVFAGVAITSDSGIARERWTLGTSTADSQRVEARAVDEAGSAVVFGVFRATARPDVPSSISKISGDSQTVVVGAPASDSLVVRIADRFNNPVPQVAVRWTVESGGGSLSTDSTVTSTDGVTRTQWTIGQQLGNPQIVTATAVGLAPLSFQATAHAAPAVRVIVAMPASGAASGLPFASPPRVRLVDQFGNTASGIMPSVVLAVSAGAELVGTSTVTPTDGEATFAGAGLRGPIGDYVLTFSATGLTSASQAVRLYAGPTASLEVATQPAGAVSGAAFTTQPVVHLLDGAGNRSASADTVTAEIASGDGILMGSTSAAADSGTARFSSLRIDRAQEHTLRFTLNGTSLSVVSSQLRVAAGQPAKLSVLVPASGAVSGGAFRSQPTVGVQDSAGNATTSIVTVTASVGGGATLVGSQIVAATSGIAEFSNLGISATVGEYTITYTAPSLSSASQTVVMLSSVAIAAGGNHSCAITQSLGAECWGMNSVGQLGDGRTLDATAPVSVAGEHTFLALAGGWYHSCALSQLGEAYCWGYNAYGALGDRESNDPSIASRLLTTRRFVEISAGGYHTCGLTASGEVYCWGLNGNGQLGDGTYSSSSAPVKVSGNVQFASVSAGVFYTCGLDRGGQAYCWGLNSLGQLGIGSTIEQVAPARVESDARFVEIRAGRNHTCARTAEGAGFCWGSNSPGQLGDGTSSQRTSPVPVLGDHRFSQLAVGDHFSCGLAIDGQAFCWGSNLNGQLGDGTTASQRSPVAVSGGHTFVSLAVAGVHACGLTMTGTAYCWGGNLSGQLGIGNKSASQPIPSPAGGGRQYWVP